MNEMTRRSFTTLAAAAGAAAPMAAAKGLENWAPGVKISMQIPTDPKPEDLQFVEQLGVGWVNIGTSGARATYETFAELKKRVEARGLKVWNIGNTNVHNMPEVTLNLEGRDAKIEEYKQYLRNLAKAGISYTTYAHMGNGIWSSEQRDHPRRGSRRAPSVRRRPTRAATGPARLFDNAALARPQATAKEGDLGELHLLHRVSVAPVAEELGIRIGIHPDDPPAQELGGVPRCIFGSFDGYKRAFEIANSPNVGMCLCCGCWLEGGPRMGKSVVETIRYFGERGRLFKVHFRNVDKPMPHFVEAFIDNGYADMYPIMKALVEVDFRGVAIADHVPAMVGHRNVGWAYCIAYMKAMLDRANAEVRKG